MVFSGGYVVFITVPNVHAGSMLSNDVGSYETIGGEQPLLGETLSIASYKNALGVRTFVACSNDAQFPTYSAVLQYFNNTSQNMPESSLVIVPKILSPYQSGVASLPMIIKLSIHSKMLYLSNLIFMRTQVIQLKENTYLLYILIGLFILGIIGLTISSH